MSEPKSQYSKLLLEKKSILEQIKVLEEDDKVKKYLELCEQKKELNSKETNLYSKMKMEEYEECNHIWIYTHHEYDSFEGRSYNYCGCIKCGLDKWCYYLMDFCNCKPNDLMPEQRIMYDYLKTHRSEKGINTKIFCDIYIGMAIYAKIKENHPNIDDETATKYFKTAIYNMKNRKVNEERKESRARRLSINSKYFALKGW